MILVDIPAKISFNDALSCFNNLISAIMLSVYQCVCVIFGRSVFKTAYVLPFVVSDGIVCFVILACAPYQVLSSVLFQHVPSSDKSGIWLWNVPSVRCLWYMVMVFGPSEMSLVFGPSEMSLVYGYGIWPQ